MFWQEFRLKEFLYIISRYITFNFIYLFIFYVDNMAQYNETLNQMLLIDSLIGRKGF